LRASVRANLIHKCFISRDVFTLIRAFKVMLGLSLNIPRVHGLLTIFLKYNKLKLYSGNSPSDFLGTRHLCYKERLLRLELNGLEMRRLLHDLLYTYKIVFNLVSEAANDMFTLANTLYSTRTQGHPFKLYLNNSFIELKTHLFHTSFPP